MAKVRVNWGALDEDCSVKLYEVFNTSNKGLYVLARDRDTAMSIAKTANHIQSTIPICSDYYSRVAHEVTGVFPAELEAYQEAIQSIIARRVQGTIHVDSGQVAVGDQVIVK